MLPRSKRTESALAKAKFGVPVTRRALIARVNRKLAERDEQVCITRGERAKQEVGAYWLRDNRREGHRA